MDHVDIIKALGGAKKVSTALTDRGMSVEPVTVRSWTLSKRMIPSKYWAHIAAIAEAQQVKVSYAALAEAAAAVAAARKSLPARVAA